MRLVEVRVNWSRHSRIYKKQRMVGTSIEDDEALTIENPRLRFEVECNMNFRAGEVFFFFFLIIF